MLQDTAFTQPARVALLTATAIAEGLEVEEARVTHLLAALLDARDSFAERTLRAAGVRRDELTGRAPDQALVTMVVLPSPQKEPPVPWSRELEAVIGRAQTVALEMGHALVGTEHVLVAVLETPETEGQSILERHGMSALKLRGELWGAA